MNTDTITQTPLPAIQPGREVTNQQLMVKLLEIEKKIEVIEKKLTTPLINQ